MSGLEHGAAIGFVKAHAYGNDFLFIEEGDVEGARLDVLAQAVWRRTHGFRKGPTWSLQPSSAPIGFGS